MKIKIARVTKNIELRITQSDLNEYNDNTTQKQKQKNSLIMIYEYRIGGRGKKTPKCQNGNADSCHNQIVDYCRNSMNRSSRCLRIQVNRWPMKWRRFRPSLRHLRRSFLVDSIPVQMMLRLVRMCCIDVDIVVVVVDVVVADIVVVVVVGRNDLGYLNH